MSDQPIDLINFLDSADRLFAELEVPLDIRVTLIKPYLSARALTLVNRLSGDLVIDYAYVKTYLLKKLERLNVECLWTCGYLSPEDIRKMYNELCPNVDHLVVNDRRVFPRGNGKWNAPQTDQNPVTASTQMTQVTPQSKPVVLIEPVSVSH